MEDKGWEEILDRECEDDLVEAAWSEQLNAIDDIGIDKVLFALVGAIACFFIAYATANIVFTGPVGGPSPVTQTYNDGNGTYYYVHDEAANYLIGGLIIVACGLSGIVLLFMGVLGLFGLVISGLYILFLKCQALSRRSVHSTVRQFLNGLFSSTSVKHQNSWNCLIRTTRQYFGDVKSLPSYRDIFLQLAGEGSNTPKIVGIQTSSVSTGVFEYIAKIICAGGNIVIHGAVCKIGSRYYVVTWNISMEHTGEILGKLEKSDLDKYIYDCAIKSQKTQEIARQMAEKLGTHETPIYYPKRLSSYSKRSTW